MGVVWLTGACARQGASHIERGLSRMVELRAIVAICERIVDPASEEN